MTMEGMRRGVLYSRAWGGDYPSIDFCGVPKDSDTFYLMQCTTAQKHRRVQDPHVQSISVPTIALQSVILYIVPTPKSSTILEDGDHPLSGEMWKLKPVSTQMVSVPKVFDDLPADVRMKFEPGGHS